MSGAGGIGSNLSAGQNSQAQGDQGASQKDQTHPWASDPWQNSDTITQYQPTPYNYPGMIASQYAGYGLTGGGYPGAFPGAGGYPPGGAIPGAGGQNNGLGGAYSAYAPTFSSLPISPLEYWQGKYDHKVGRSDGTVTGVVAGGAGGAGLGGIVGWLAGKLIGGRFQMATTAVGAVLGGVGGTAVGGNLGGDFGEWSSIIDDTKDDGRSNGSTAGQEQYPYAHAYNPNNVNLAY